jgi:D-sedoheptulose 7-phosphate isomerase
LDNLEYIKNYFENSLAIKKKLLADETLLKKIEEVALSIEDVYSRSRKVLIAGNGGSAGDAQHIAAELVSRFFYDRPGLSAVALTTDTSMLTAIGNDYGFEKIFSRQVQAQGVEGDIFIGISTSGNSKNIIEAVSEAKAKGIRTVALCGSEGSLAASVDIALEIPSDCTPHIQECHICVGHILCALVEKNIFPLG